MIDCVSVANMRLSDRKTMEAGISSAELIWRAANAIYHSVCWWGSVAIVTGSGNNGADGFALACILKTQGISVHVFTVAEKLHEDAAFYASYAKRAGVPIGLYKRGALLGYDIIVDCLLGTGFNGILRENYQAAIEEINDTNAYIVSVDINSGMNGDTGHASVAVKSDITVTVQFLKNGLVQQCAGTFMKRLKCVDIGILLAAEENKLCSDEEWELLCSLHHVSSDDTFHEIDDRVFYRRPHWVDI